MHFEHDFCHGKATVASWKYQHQYPNQRQVNRHMLTQEHDSLSKTNALMPVHTLAMVHEQEVLDAVNVQASTSTSWVRDEQVSLTAQPGVQ
jgi:hypothetical protein